jgi:amidohydrolase
MEAEALKSKVCQSVAENKDLAISLSERIHANPEIAFSETKAMGWLTEALRGEGFSVQSPVADLATAFRGEYCGGPGPTVALLAEYDALPGIGHGCGHNLICTSAVTAASALKSAWPDMPGTIVVLGTPAEEDGGGKIIMLDRGAFTGVDVSMMFHPGSITTVNSLSLARAGIDFTFHGVASHSAMAPEEGINAADAAMLLFAGVNAFRQHVQPDVRIHGYIKEAGVKPNIVPYLSRVQMMVRAERLEYLETLVDRVIDIARGAALMTGASMEFERDLTYYDFRPVETLGRLALDNFARLGISPIPVTPEMPRASGDAGNVSHALPHLRIEVALADHPIRGHSEEWRDAAITPMGQEAMLTAAKVLAQTACDIFAEPTVLDTIRTEHKAAVGRTL